MAEELAASAPPEFREWLAFSASQARGHRNAIASFGRHPHRNEVLGRRSTPEELAYLERGEFVHKRDLPVNLEGRAKRSIGPGASLTPALSNLSKG